jgi:F-type H+-transporting ATPase subunit b
VSLLELLAPAQALAAAAAEAEHQAHHAVSINDIWFPLGNFIIYVFIIVKFALPLVRDFLRTRRQDLIDTVEAASAKKRAAEALVSEYKAKIAGLAKEVQSLDAVARDEGQRDKIKLIADAASLATKIKDDARFLGEQEVRMARQKVREEMADHAEAQARELIQRNLSAADQARLVEDFIQNIGQAR